MALFGGGSGPGGGGRAEGPTIRASSPSVSFSSEVSRFAFASAVSRFAFRIELRTWSIRIRSCRRTATPWDVINDADRHWMVARLGVNSRTCFLKLRLDPHRQRS